MGISNIGGPSWRIASQQLCSESLLIAVVLYLF